MVVLATVTDTKTMTTVRAVGSAWTVPANTQAIDLLAYGGPVDVMDAADDTLLFRLPNGILFPATAFLKSGEDVWFKGPAGTTVGIIYRYIVGQT